MKVGRSEACCEWHSQMLGTFQLVSSDGEDRFPQINSMAVKLCGTVACLACMRTLILSTKNNDNKIFYKFTDYSCVKRDLKSIHFAIF